MIETILGTILESNKTKIAENIFTLINIVKDKFNDELTEDKREMYVEKLKKNYII